MVYTLFVSFGNILGSIIVYYLFGRVNVPAYVALYTSILTATYTILTEPKQKTEPILRISPLVIQTKNPLMFNYNVDVWIENIGYGIAKNIEAKVNVSSTDRYSKTFTHEFLAPKEKINFPIDKYMERKFYDNEQIMIELAYLNKDDKKIKPLKAEFKVKELPESFKEVRMG